MSVKLAAAIATALISAAADAVVVPFLQNPTKSWLDGTMTYDLSPYYDDGFYNYGDGPTHAFNAFGQNNESIMFNTPVKLASLTLSNCFFCVVNADTVTVTLFGGDGGLLASQTIVPHDTLTVLTFNIDAVRKATFSFTGGRYNYYNDGRVAAFYKLSDLLYVGGTYTGTYTGPSYTLPITTPNPGDPVTSVPEAATRMMMIAGFGLVGAGLRQRRIVRPA